MSAPDRLATPHLASHADAVAAAHAFADSIADGVVERDRSGAAPREEMARFDASGLPAITVPHAEGGPALGPSTLAEVIRVIAAVGPGDRADAPGPLPVRRRRGPAGDREPEAAAARRGAGRQPDRQRAGRARDHPRPGPQDPAAHRRGRRPAPARAQVLLHGDADGAVDRRHRPRRATTGWWSVFVGRHDDGRDRRPRTGTCMGQRATVSGTTDFDNVTRRSRARARPTGRRSRGRRRSASRAQLVHAAIEVGIAGGALRDARAFLRDKARPFFEAVRGGWAQKAVRRPALAAALRARWPPRSAPPRRLLAVGRPASSTRSG